MRASRQTLLLACVLMALMLAFPASALAKKPGDANPTITSLSAYASPAGTVITINGSGFGQNKISSWVTFAGVRGTHLTWTDTAITATVPTKSAAGYVGVVVDGIWSNGAYFVPFAQPTVSAVSTASAAPGERVTLTGSNFGPSQGSGTVTFAGVSAPVVSWSDTSIVVTVPSGAPSGYVGVWQNTLCSNGTWFVPDGMPAIDALSATTSVLGDRVTVKGRNFGASTRSGIALTVAGQPVTPDAWSDTEITFTVARGMKTGYVGAWKDALCSNGAFLVVGPRIDALSSWWGEPGSQLTITGEGFGAAPDRVTMAGADIAIVSWTDTRIVATVPAGVPEGYVGVWTGEGCSNGIWFLPATQPMVSSVDATAVAAGQTLTITGTAFDARTPYSQVKIGATDLVIQSWTADTIVATVPAGATSGYLGVWKKGIASNGVWIDVAP